MSKLFIGLMSGTSVDSIDAVIVDFAAKPLKLIASHKEKIPALLKRRLLHLCYPAADEINQLGQLDRLMGKLLAYASLNVLKKAQITPNKIIAIGSHGQTVRHMPHGKSAFTLQIGDPNTIAALTGIATIADFRRRDLAEGGEGAPLAPAFHRYLFSKVRSDSVMVNIGGMANITVLSPRKVLGFDTGPGNVLLDAWIKKHRNLTYDRNGTWAAKGAINQKLLRRLVADPYFARKPPKSTGREYFNLQWLHKYLCEKLKPQDVQATLTELTAFAITQSINTYAQTARRIFICGGGAYNRCLMQRLIALNPSRQIATTAMLGIEPILIEPIAFAWFAYQTFSHQPIDLTSVTGAKRPVILGGVYHS